MGETVVSGLPQLHPTLGLAARINNFLHLQLHDAQGLAVHKHGVVLVCLRRKSFQRHLDDMDLPDNLPLVTKHRRMCTGYRIKPRIRPKWLLRARNPFPGISISGMLHPGGEDFMIIDESITFRFDYRAVGIYIALSSDI